MLSTIKSLCTVKCGKTIAALANAFSYGFGVVVTVYTMSDLPLLVKCLAIGSCNFIGVFVVKTIEEKLQKEKLWKLEITIPSEATKELISVLEFAQIPYNYIPNIGKWTIFNCYCSTKKQSKTVIEVIKNYGGKTFATENLLRS
jgi:hypothetical protein